MIKELSHVMFNSAVMSSLTTLVLCIFSLGIDISSGSDPENYVDSNLRKLLNIQQNVPYVKNKKDGLASSVKRGWEALDFRGKRRMPLDDITIDKRAWEPLDLKFPPFPQYQRKRAWEPLEMLYHLKPNQVTPKSLAGSTEDDNWKSIERMDTMGSCLCCKKYGHSECCMTCVSSVDEVNDPYFNFEKHYMH